MRRIRRFALVVLGCAIATLFLVPVAGADTSVTTCSGSFTGTAQNLDVPFGECDLQGAHIANDVTVERGGILIANNSTIGHDLISGSTDFSVRGGLVVLGSAQDRAGWVREV